MADGAAEEETTALNRIVTSSGVFLVRFFWRNILVGVSGFALRLVGHLEPNKRVPRG